MVQYKKMYQDMVPLKFITTCSLKANFQYLHFGFKFIFVGKTTISTFIPLIIKLYFIPYVICSEAVKSQLCILMYVFQFTLTYITQVKLKNIK